MVKNNQKKNLFASTRQLNHIYKILVPASKRNLEKRLGKELDIIIIKKKFPSLKFLLFFIYVILSGKIFSSSKLILVKYRDCNLGRYVYPTVTRNIEETGSSIWVEFFLRFKYLFLGGAVVDTGYYLSKKISGAYVDHGIYLNGLYVEVFLRNNIRIYSNNTPKGLFTAKKIRKNQNNFSYENLIKLENKNLNYKQKQKAEKKIRKRITNPKYIPWMKIVRFKRIKEKINFDNFDYIIYAHAFTDAQLCFGYDGYANVNDWLIDTLRILINLNKKVIIKPHPNFYDYMVLKLDQKKREKNISYRDHKKYLEIKDLFSSENIYFLDSPYSNIDFLKKLNKKKHIIISLHSSAILECCYFGFKCIISKASFWDENISIANAWGNRDEYKKILNKKFENLNYPIKNNLIKIIHELFFNRFGQYGKNYYITIICKLLNLKELPKYDKNFKELNSRILNSEKKTIKTIYEISKNIEEIRLQ